MNIHILLNITWVKEEISREMKELFKLNENKNTAYEKYTENSAYREIYSIKYIYQQRRRRKIKKNNNTKNKNPNILPQETRKRITIQVKPNAQEKK